MGMKRKQAAAVKTGGVSADFSRTCAGCACILEESGAKGGVNYRCNAPGPRKGYTVSNAGRFLPYVPAWCPLLGTGKEGTVKPGWFKGR